MLLLTTWGIKITLLLGAASIFGSEILPCWPQFAVTVLSDGRFTQQGVRSHRDYSGRLARVENAY